jgi:hypothetical protein
LDTDYLIDNGLIQVREDGGYIGRHNPDFFAKLEGEYFAYGFFTFDNAQITITSADQDYNFPVTHLSDVPVVDQHIENSNTSASISVTRANQYFRFVTQTTVYQGVPFANMTVSIASLDPNMHIGLVTFTLQTKGMLVLGENETSLAFFNQWDKVAGQLIFKENQPSLPINVGNLGSPGVYDLTYNINGQSNTRIQIFASSYQYDANPSDELTDAQKIAYYQNIETDHAKSYDKSVANPEPLDVFNYQQALASLNVSYVALRDAGQINRFLKDSTFSLVFINNEVAIFRVNT